MSAASYWDDASSTLSTIIGGALWERANFSRFLREVCTLCEPAAMDDLLMSPSSKLCLQNI